MNNLVNFYNLILDYPEVSGAEQLEVLEIRDQIAELETELSEEDKTTQKLMKNVAIIYKEISRFINLADYRKK